MYTRKDYMNKKVTHRQYYGQFVTPAIIDQVVSFIGDKVILASTNEHMNDIPLKKWDTMHQFLPNYYAKAMREAAPQSGISRSDTVCVAKEAARQFVESKSK